ncbi:hypothetical protein D3C78_1854720 [compost metagenome]
MLDVVSELGDTGELLVQFGNDRGDITLTIDQSTDKGRAFVELDHALGVEQHVALLRWLVLETITRTPFRGLRAIKTHKAIPLCQTLSLVTL